MGMAVGPTNEVGSTLLDGLEALGPATAKRVV